MVCKFLSSSCPGFYFSGVSDNFTACLAGCSDGVEKNEGERDKKIPAGPGHAGIFVNYFKLLLSYVDLQNLILLGQALPAVTGYSQQPYTHEQNCSRFRDRGGTILIVQSKNGLRKFKYSIPQAAVCRD